MQTKEKPSEQCYPGSVLLSDHMESFVDRGLLIVDDTFSREQLDRAKYNVRLGKAYYRAGKWGNLDDNNPLLEIGPYELVFVESYEVFKMPENVVAKYDLRISGCLGGLGLQTGLQLDPTYYGRFFCPLFNFSDQIFSIWYKEQLASVEFSYTTKPDDKGQTKKFDGRNNLFSLRHALLSPRQSGMGKLWEKLQEFDSAATRLHTRVDTMITVVYTTMAFMIATLGVTVAAVATTLSSGVKLQPLPVTITLVVLFGITLVVIGIGGYALIRKIWRKVSEQKENVTRH